MTRVLDAVGTPIAPGDTVVVSDALHRLVPRTVTGVERVDGAALVTGGIVVRFEGGSCTDPNRVAVVAKAGRPS